MKKYIIFSLFVLAFVQIFSACTEDNLTPSGDEKPKSLFEIITSRGGSGTTTDGDITVVALDYLYGGQFPLDNFDFSGYFKNASGVGVPVSNFTIGGYNIPEQSNFRYTLNKSIVIPSDNISQAMNTLCGQEVNYVVTSTDFGNISTSLHMPATLNATISNGTSIPGTSIDRNNPLHISWQPDPYVGDGEDDEQVGVAIIYHAGLSANQEQEGMPAQNIIVYKQANDVSGTVSFSGDELSAFPVNSYVTVYCGRAHQKITTSSTGRTVAITNLMMATTSEMKIQ